MILPVTLALTIVVQGTPPATEVLPAPTGPHATGRMSMHWRDTRPELETRAPDDTRELMVHLFYPADANTRGVRAAYVPDAEAMRPPWSDAQVERITAMRAYSIENAPMLGGSTRHPVIVFVPGGGMKGLTYHALLEDLASHGWVVAAVDPPYNARAVRLPDGRVLGNLAAADRGWPAPRSADEEVRFYRERVAHLARDVRFVIDQLTALDRDRGPFLGRLDLRRGVGVVGHSRGGQAAGTVRLIDDRVRGAINLDGAAGDFPGFQPYEADTSSGAAPFLWVLNPPRPPSDEQLQRAGRTRAQYDSMFTSLTSTWHHRLSRVSGGALLVAIERQGVEHIDFSDEPFWNGRTTPEARPGKLQTITETRAWVRAFFDGAVRDDWSLLRRLVDASERNPSGTRVTVFSPPWQR